MLVKEVLIQGALVCINHKLLRSPGFDSYACKALILFDRILKNAPTAVLAAAAGLAYLFLGHGSPYSVR